MFKKNKALLIWKYICRKEAQRCYCETTSCRGWIGEDPEKENKWSDLSGRNKERKEREKKKKEDKRKDMLDDIDVSVNQ